MTTLISATMNYEPIFIAFSANSFLAKLEAKECPQNMLSKSYDASECPSVTVISTNVSIQYSR